MAPQWLRGLGTQTLQRLGCRFVGTRAVLCDANQLLDLLEKARTGHTCLIVSRPTER
jgi:hypothetical protein